MKERKAYMVGDAAEFRYSERLKRWPHHKGFWALTLGRIWEGLIMQIICDHIEKRKWSLRMDVGSPKTSPAIITCICRVTNLTGQRNKKTVCIRVSEKTLAVFSRHFEVCDGETWTAEFGSWGIFSGFGHRARQGRWSPVWAVTKLCLRYSPI